MPGHNFTYVAPLLNMSLNEEGITQASKFMTRHKYLGNPGLIFLTMKKKVY